MNWLFEVTDQENKKVWCGDVAMTCAAGLAVLTVGALICAACQRWPSAIKTMITIGAALVVISVLALAIATKGKIKWPR